MRFRIEPRDVPAASAARRLGLTEAEFDKRLPTLFARGFPSPDPTTGNFDLRAIDAWQDRRSGLGGVTTPIARDAAAVVTERLGRMSHG